MTDHADTLRGMARDRPPAVADPGALALTAGADALDTLKKVRAAVERIDRARSGIDLSREPDYGGGLHYGLTLAGIIITDALGDTHEQV